jgi:hypothetical protein
METKMSHKMLIALAIFGASDALRGDRRKTPEPGRIRGTGSRARAGCSRPSPFTA